MKKSAIAVLQDECIWQERWETNCPVAALKRLGADHIYHNKYSHLLVGKFIWAVRHRPPIEQAM